MKGIPRGRYTKEFRQEAVKLVTEEKLSWSEAGRRLSLAPSTIGNWVKAYETGKLGEIGKTYLTLPQGWMLSPRDMAQNVIAQTQETKINYHHCSII